MPVAIARIAKLLLAGACAATLGSGCATEVYQPGKTKAEAQAAIDRCSEEAKRVYWYDAITALDYAYTCLDKLGYRRGSPEMATERQQAVRSRVLTPNEPCVVPCTTPR